MFLQMIIIVKMKLKRLGNQRNQYLMMILILVIWLIMKKNKKIVLLLLIIVPVPSKEIEKYMDEYYQLDYEDVVGDLPVRFKYRQTEPETYNMTAEEILMADDVD